MSFDWVDFVKLAKKLIENKDEASFRSSISRAYYGVFCIARNRKGLKKYKKGDVHKIVIERFKNSDNYKDQYIGKVLDDLRRNRNNADYDEDKEVNFKLAKRVINKTERVLKRLKIKY